MKERHRITFYRDTLPDKQGCILPILLLKYQNNNTDSNIRRIFFSLHAKIHKISEYIIRVRNHFKLERKKQRVNGFFRAAF